MIDPQSRSLEWIADALSQLFQLFGFIEGFFV